MYINAILINKLFKLKYDEISIVIAKKNNSNKVKKPTCNIIIEKGTLLFSTAPHLHLVALSSRPGYQLYL